MADRNEYAEMITSHTATIEALCGQIVSRNRSIPYDAECDGFSIVSEPDRTDPENEKHELFNAALDHLASEDFAVVRKFSNKSKFSTYLASVISRLAVDIVRHKRGRSRVKEKAEKMGDVAGLLYDLIYVQRYTPIEAQGVLETSHGIQMHLNEIIKMLDRMRGSGKTCVSIPECPAGVIVGSSENVAGKGAELVIPEADKTPEALLAEMERSVLAKIVVSEFLGTLNGRDKLMIRMRFPMVEGEKAETYREIGATLGMSEDTVQRNMDKILKDFRECLISRGVSLGDLI